MTILGVENLSRNFGIKPLFDNLTFGLEERDRVGLIGANGTGKTTLLRIIAGVETPDTGRVMIAGNPVIGYLPQNPDVDESLTVLETIFAASNESMRLLGEYEDACHLLATNTSGAAHDSAMQRVSELAVRLDAIGAWELETNARVVLTKLGITDTSALMGELSGGQRKRVMLAHALIERPDLLILDEPTNHLDADTIEWLESFLSRYSGALLLVTHDRYFLDRVTNRIIELDRGTAQTYAGNYSWYLEKKAEQQAREETESHKRDMLIRQELAWLRKGAKARTTKQKARIERAEDLMSAPRDKPREELDISVGSRRLGSRVVELHNISKGYDGRVLVDAFTRILEPGERLGIIGPNGAGKTTLLDIIMGAVTPDSGRVQIGATVVIGYYDQESRALNEEQRVIDYIREIAENIKTADGSVITAGQMLERFLFPAAMQYAPIGRLSGGERRRLYLLRVLMGAPNVLLLDEPTNDFDIPTLMALEEYLDTFPGVVVAVSHDRYFLDRTVGSLVAFEEEGKIKAYPGNYSVYLDIRRRQEAESVAAVVTKKPEAPLQQQPTAAKPAKLSYKEQKEFQKLESDIQKAESRKGQLEAQIALAGIDYTLVQTLTTQISDIDAQIERDMQRWSELGERT